MRLKPIIFISAALLMTAVPANVLAIQPWEVIRHNPQDFYVHQGPALCGPTAFYMIFKYLGDHESGPDNIDLTETIPADGKPVLGRSSKMATYIRSLGRGSGTRWSQLEKAVTSMQKDSRPFYSVMRSNPRTADRTKRQAILARDIIPLLETNTPVLVHLRRPGWFAGHYLVIIGYDRQSAEIIYLDPNNRRFDPRNPGFDAGTADWSKVVQRVGYRAFATENWYDPPGLLPAACWDGRWLGFRH